VSAPTRFPSDVAEQVSLGRHTSLRVGGPARYYLAGGDVAALARLVDAAREDDLPILFLGGGSNLLIADDGFDGVVVRYTTSGHRLEPLADDTLAVRAEAGTNLSALARRLGHEGLAGLEWAANVPGTVGGAVVNNAGAFGGCIADHLIDAEIVRPDGSTQIFTGEELGYAYRTSVLKRVELGPVLVRSARLRVRRDEPTQVTRRIQELQTRRTASQPRQLSAGSIFANPPGDYSGRLIEAVGLKGERRGGAEISAHHANFIVNAGSATAGDVLALIRLAQDTVWGQFGIWLHPEVQLVGQWDPRDVAALAGPPEQAARGAP
jgi:UDP-N-acetylmuramate dehydrogenase